LPDGVGIRRVHFIGGTTPVVEPGSQISIFTSGWLITKNSRDKPARNQKQRYKAHNMKDSVYKLIELTGTSTTSMEDAISTAIKRAHKTIKNLCWFQVVETRGNIENGKVHHWQVTLKVGFAVKDS
jgi:flavin-binding protein dodecin